MHAPFGSKSGWGEKDTEKISPAEGNQKKQPGPLFKIRENAPAPATYGGGGAATHGSSQLVTMTAPAARARGAKARRWV